MQRLQKKVKTLFDLRPKAIEQRLKLRNPIYLETASYGHMGRESRVVKKVFNSRYMPEPVIVSVELLHGRSLTTLIRSGKSLICKIVAQGYFRGF